MPDGNGSRLPTQPALQHMDWSKAIGNQKEEQLRAFLAEYPADLRRTVADMQEALRNKDFEKLREAAQQVMGSSSFVAASALHNVARELVEAIDLESDEISEKTNKTADEAEKLEKELVSHGFAVSSSQVEVTPSSPSKTTGQVCCGIS
mmetsp:Transcript_103461/g.183795  ORF Transcript_103461/g.183795 Transcript_103461/m.183795 type:complete len:149 (-) Transcript_103461:139-585(-)